MPVILKSALHESGDSHEVTLFQEGGELTIAGEVVADFLETADFTQVFEHPEAEPYVITVVDETDENVFEEVLPGTVALRLIDEVDMAEMFLHYLDLIGENALAEDASLEAKTKLAVFENLLLKPLDEKYKRGAFRQMRRAEGGAQGRNSQVNMMLGAMLKKGEIKRAKKSGGGYKGGDYEKGGRYKSGATKAGKAKAKQVSRRMQSKNLRGKASSSSKRAARRGRALAASVGMEEGFLFGFGETFHGSGFQVGVKPDAEVEFSEAELSDLLTTYAEGYTGMVKAKGRRGMKLAEKVEESAEGSESKRDLSGLDESSPRVPIGVASLSEGAGIAARVVGVLSGPKPAKKLDEATR